MKKLENNIVYYLYNNMYLNITNRCCNSCEFCIRKTTDKIGNFNLWLTKEPSTEEIIKAISNPANYNEVIFCGYGEPLIRLDTVIDVCKYLRNFKVPIRINTNGLANLIHNENIVPKLVSLVDTISISLNAENAVKYDKLCHSIYGLKAFDAILEFAKLCKQYLPQTVLTVLDIPEVDINKCKEIAQSLDIPLRVRSYSEEL